MVPPFSDRISRVPPYSNGLSFCGYGAVTRSGPVSHPVRLYEKHGLVRVRSPLLAESRLMSFPPGTEMFQFPGFALKTLCIQVSSTCSGDLSFAPRRSAAAEEGAVGQTTNHRQVGCPIRRSRDHRVLSPPPGLSQSATSFIASCRQGIHQTPFSRLIRSGERGSQAGSGIADPGSRSSTGRSTGEAPRCACIAGAASGRSPVHRSLPARHPRQGAGRSSVSALDLERLSLSVLPLASLAA